MSQKHFEVAFAVSIFTVSNGINTFAQQFQVHTLILGAEVAQSRHNLIWLLCGIMSSHRILSRHREVLTKQCKDALCCTYSTSFYTTV